MRRDRAILVLVLLAAATALGARVDLGGSGSGSGAGRGGLAAGGGATATARVVRVVDGDTIKVSVGGARDTVRYIGIDTPESVKPGTPVQCYAKAASAENERLVAGQTVRLVAGEDPRDRYGRLLAYVYRARDGRFVNAALVRDGFARTLTIRPNDRFAAAFASLQAEARSRGRGLWRACA